MTILDVFCTKTVSYSSVTKDVVALAVSTRRNVFDASRLDRALHRNVERNVDSSDHPRNPDEDKVSQPVKFLALRDVASRARRNFHL